MAWENPMEIGSFHIRFTALRESGCSNRWNITAFEVKKKQIFVKFSVSKGDAAGTEMLGTAPEAEPQMRFGKLFGAGQLLFSNMFCWFTPFWNVAFICIYVKNALVLIWFDIWFWFELHYHSRRWRRLSRTTAFVPWTQLHRKGWHWEWELLRDQQIWDVFCWRDSGWSGCLRWFSSLISYK